jgi:hypothetical protein
LGLQRFDSGLLIAINKKINGFLRGAVSGMKNPGALPGFPCFLYYFYFTGWGITTMPTIFSGYVADIALVDGDLEG